jgi:hypothetical protein
LRATALFHGVVSSCTLSIKPGTCLLWRAACVWLGSNLKIGLNPHHPGMDVETYELGRSTQECLLTATMQLPATHVPTLLPTLKNNVCISPVYGKTNATLLSPILPHFICFCR